MSLNWLRGAPLVILSLAALLLSGCVTIEVIDRTPSMPEPATPTGEDRAQEHDLAVLAVDFDPPLEYEEIVAQRNRGEGITLLVAVENTGIHTERDVTVEVVLSSDNGMTVYLQKQGSIAAIAPGEIKIIHFEDTEIPFSYKYTLWVRAVPVLGETRLGDNQKSYDLLITQP